VESHTADTCRSCGSRRLQWERDVELLTGSWRWLRCKSCGDGVRLLIPDGTWALYTVAIAMIVWALWVVRQYL